MINALALSHIWYVASLLPMPNWVLGRNFGRQWGARGVVVYARDDHLVVHWWIFCCLLRFTSFGVHWRC